MNARGQALSIAVHGWDLRSSSWQVLLSPRRARKCTREVSGGSASGESEDEGTADERERERERKRKRWKEKDREKEKLLAGGGGKDGGGGGFQSRRYLYAT